MSAGCYNEAGRGRHLFPRLSHNQTMRKRPNHASRVPSSRVALLALSLVVFPSLTVNARHSASLAVRRSAPVAIEQAGAVAFAGTAAAAASAAALDRGRWEDAALGGADVEVFEMALGAARCAIKNGVVADPATLTVIDYSKPSTEQRLWVYDLRDRELIYKELVAHGQGSGANYATAFSNEPDTHRTSIGLFVTEDTYVGRNGYSLRLHGLDRGFNDRARERAIVMHGAPYVSKSFIKSQGRLGRSWGCPAVSDVIAREVIDTVKGGSLVFAYYPDQKWLASSKFLEDCD